MVEPVITTPLYKTNIETIAQAQTGQEMIGGGVKVFKRRLNLDGADDGGSTVKDERPSLAKRSSVNDTGNLR